MVPRPSTASLVAASVRPAVSTTVGSLIRAPYLGMGAVFHAQNKSCYREASMRSTTLPDRGANRPVCVPLTPLEVRAPSARAAYLPGNAATRSASTSAPRPTYTSGNVGTVAPGTAEISWSKMIQSQRPGAMPTGIPAMSRMATAIVNCQATVAVSWRWGKAESLQQREVPSTTLDRSGEDKAKCNDCTDSEPGREKDGRDADGPVVLDLRGILDPRLPAGSVCGLPVPRTAMRTSFWTSMRRT